MIKSYVAQIIYSQSAISYNRTA